jgi:polygalacturonase
MHTLMKHISSLFVILPLFFLPFNSYSENVNMKLQGADDCGKKLNTELINQTITDLSSKGGGTLYFPAGTYLTGAIKLKSNITIELESGAVLLFSDNFDDYLPFVEMRYEGVVMKSFSPLFYAINEENIAIKGRGTINGQGEKWWKEFYRIIEDMQKNGIRDINKYQSLWKKENNIEELYKNTNEDYKNTLQRRFFRPPLFQPIRCKNILVEGVTIINSPFWTINPEFCENVTIKGITINNPISPNTDGINPSSCKNVHISDCHINVGDDCITLKSGRDKQGRDLATPCENITITNCTMLAGHGGVVIGSEMSGDVRKVVISNCVFDGTDRGIRIKSTRGRGGIVEEISVNNIVMKDIKEEAIVLNLFYSKMNPEPVSERTPIFRNIHISNLVGTKINTAVKILGLEEMPVSDVTLSNIHIQSATGLNIDRAKNINLNNVRIDASKGIPFVLSHIDNAILTNVSTGLPSASVPVISISDSKEIFIRGCFPLAGNKAFLHLQGENNDIILMNNYLKRLPQIVDKESKGSRNGLIVE